MGRAHEVRKSAMEKTAAQKTKVYSRFGKEIYMAAKSGVPDPDMNQALKRVIEKAKAAQVPSDVIKRNIEKAKGNSTEDYFESRYEGFGPGASTIIIDVLTDNANRAIGDVRTCFNKAHANLGVKGSVSHSYDNFGILSFAGNDEEAVLDALIMAVVDVKELECDDGSMTVYVEPTDLYKAKDAIDGVYPDINYDVLESQMMPQEYVTLEDEEQLMLFNHLVNLLDEVDDVQRVYHNVELT